MKRNIPTLSRMKSFYLDIVTGEILETLVCSDAIRYVFLFDRFHHETNAYSSKYYEDTQEYFVLYLGVLTMKVNLSFEQIIYRTAKLNGNEKK